MTEWVTPDFDAWMHQLLPVLRQAGQRILDISDSGDWNVEVKSDNSPVTRADKESEQIILTGLRHLAPDVPVMSEEQTEASLAERASWQRFWCLDPLDGTKEFINRTGEFAINLAFVEGRRPVFGLIHIPAQRLTYAAWRGGGSMRVDHDDRVTPIKARPPGAELVLLGSRFHSGGEADIVKAGCDRVIRPLIVGSAIKFCRMAEGQGDLYVRMRPTSEWDTAAGQIIVEESGGGIFALDGMPLMYNKASLKNPGFVAIADPTLPWMKWIGAK